MAPPAGVLADLTVRPPGVPDQPSAGEPVVAELVDDSDSPPVSPDSVRGLVLGGAGILHQVLASRYPERPDVAVMTEDEADRIATALVSMSTRNAGLRSILERADMAQLIIVLGGYSGRIANDVREAVRQRKDLAHGNDSRPGGPDGRHAGSPGQAVVGDPRSVGDGRSDAGGLRAAVPGAMA